MFSSRIWGLLDQHLGEGGWPSTPSICNGRRGDRVHGAFKPRFAISVQKLAHALARYGLVGSMPRAGADDENVATKSFFALLQKGLSRPWPLGHLLTSYGSLS